MLMLIKRAFAAVIVVAAVAAPTAAHARPNVDPIRPTVPLQPSHTIVAPDADQAAATSSSGFQWDDAGIGAGSLLVLISVGAGAAVVYRRRARPLAS
jgi:uncharacterized membrane protein YphA (DoxX/SURF4 family)